MPTIHEPARDVPVIHDCDLCVLGGSCTGVFAAVRAARLGATVAIVERLNAFGGTATHGLVNIWHSIHDTAGDRPIIGGLSVEVVKRLERRGAVALHARNPNRWCEFNSEELKLELDELVVEHDIRPFLHTSYCAPVAGADGRVEAVLVENKDGRGAIRARQFIDATGDGDLMAHLGQPYTIGTQLQPPTVCARLRNFWREGLDFQALHRQHRQEFGLEPDAGWSGPVPGLPDTQLFAETHVFGANCATADGLTRAEIEGRRQLRACMDMLRKHAPGQKPLALEAIASAIGIRETRRFAAEYTVTEEDLLWGRPFADTVAQGSYRIDLHNPTGGGFVFKYLDGTMVSHDAAGTATGRWRGAVAQDPTWYNIPYRVMVSRRLPNAIMAGRMVAADRGAYGALRVMINLNQLGEAAGVAAVLANRHGIPVATVAPAELRQTLGAGGSILL
ncbi:MAG: FAD-dependent oxidoreductase [Lentisphaeria bacterium]|jgi:hypothetical protein